MGTQTMECFIIGIILVFLNVCIGLLRLQSS